MDKPLVERWVAALRSGKYSQTTGALGDAKGYCCLGVLCDVAKPEAWHDTVPGYHEYGSGYINATGIAAMEFPELAYYQDNLARKNDEGASFTEIADYIENLFLKEETNA